MIKDILAIVDDGDHAQTFLKTVAELAAAREATLEVAALTPAPTASPGTAPFGTLYVPEWVLMGDDQANVERVRAHLAAAGSSAEIFGLHDDIGWLAGNLKRRRQVADLIAIGARETWANPWLRRRVAETLIRASGTPLLILPEEQTLKRWSSAVIGWKAGPEATRAMHTLVQLADPGALIDVVTVGTSLHACEGEQEAHAEVKRHLLRHGFDAQGHWVVNDDKSEAETLTLYAQEIGADLIAIGGFAHSRIREILLGGVTGDLLERTETPLVVVG